MSIRPRARVRLSNIVANWRAMGTLNPGVDVAGVVKANAYGHGASEVAVALAEAGCRTFYVAYGFEGMEVRDVVGPDAQILVFNGLTGEDIPLAAKGDLTPVINTVDALREWLNTTDGAPYALHVDTGMNRLGVRMEDVARVADLAADHPPHTLISHLACSDEAPWDMNAAQLSRFNAVAERFPDAVRSLSNTGGSYLAGAYGADQIRPGIGLYGGGATPPDGTTILPGMTLEAPILSVQNVPAGETVGYGATYKVERPSLLATVSLGYGDGFPRSASNKGFAMIDGQRCPIVGRVSMDLITIDVTLVPALAKQGAFAQFIGPDVPLEAQARLAGTVGYELTTGLGHRVERIYEI